MMRGPAGSVRRGVSWVAAFVILVAATALPAWAADAVGDQPNAAALASIRERLAQPDVLRGTFAQEKQLAGFRNALKSSGRFVIARGRGVVWDTLTPFASGMTVTAERVTSRAADGSTQVEIDAKRQPGLAAVNRLLFAVLAGDVSALSERFAPSPTLGQGDAWQLALTPRPGPLADVLASVSLEGDRHVRKVRIEERAGDVTSIVFDDFSEAPATLATDEAARFE